MGLAGELSRKHPLSKGLRMFLLSGAMLAAAMVSGCPKPVASNTSEVPILALQVAPVANGKHPGVVGEAVPYTFGVRWPEPSRMLLAMPETTQAVSFLVSQNEQLLQTVTVIRSTGSTTASKTVSLFPGDYTVRVRAFATDTPTSASPVIAAGAQSFTVVAGQPAQTVSISLTVSSSPMPASPLPTASPTQTVSPTPTPTLSPTPTPALGVSQVSPGMTITDAFFVDFLDGWVVGEGAKVKMTTNAGVSWLSKDVTGVSALNLLSVHFLSPTVGWVAGYVGSFGTPAIYRTSDGGATWNPVPRTGMGSGNVDDLFFSDADQGLATTNSLCTTANGGQTWATVDGATPHWLFGLSNSVVFALGGDYWNNSSPTWRYEAGGLTRVCDDSLWFISSASGSPNTLLAANKWRDLYGSSDGGMSWVKKQYQLTGPIQSTDVTWGGVGLLSATKALGTCWTDIGWDTQSAAVVESSDGGATWASKCSFVLDYGITTRVMRPRFFAFDVRHAWQLGPRTTSLLRIGSPSDYQPR